VLGQHHADRNVRLLDKVDHRRARMGLTNSELTLLETVLPPFTSNGAVPVSMAARSDVFFYLRNAISKCIPSSLLL
jgi:hypothetical protein